MPIETHYHQIKRGMSIEPGIKVFCSECLDDEKQQLFLVEHLEDTGPNFRKAREAAEIHRGTFPSHHIVIALFSYPDTI